MMDATCPAIYAAMEAGRKDIPFIPLRGLLGSDLIVHRPDWKTIDNPFAKRMTRSPLLPAIRPDVALLHAPYADRNGNIFIGRRRDFALMAQAARHGALVTRRGSPRRRPDGLRGDRGRRPARDLCRGGGHRRRAAPGRSASAVATRSTRRISAATASWPAPPTASRAISTSSSISAGRPPSERDFAPGAADPHVIARLLKDCRSVAVGASSPIPGAGALLARHERDRYAAAADVRHHPGQPRAQRHERRRRRTVRHGSARTRRRLLPGRRPDRRRGQHQSRRRGRDLSADRVRWPGSFGSAYLYFLVPA